MYLVKGTEVEKPLVWSFILVGVGLCLLIVVAVDVKRLKLSLLSLFSSSLLFLGFPRDFFWTDPIFMQEP